MNKLTAPVLLAAVLLSACAAASGPQSLPERIHYNRIGNASYDAGSASSVDQLLHILPRLLAVHGYFIARTQEIATGFQFVTDWRVRSVHAEESFEGAQLARTRLVVDARRRGTRYAITLYAVSFVEDANGNWREVRPSQVMERQVRDIGRSMLLDLR